MMTQLTCTKNGQAKHGLRRFVSGVVFIMLSISANAQKVAIKSNLLYDVCGVPSLGVELKTSQHTSASLIATYNPMKFGGYKWKNFTYQPEFRYWFHRTFTGPYLAANVAGGGFNFDKLHLGGLYGKHRQGHFLGAGVGCGYNIILSDNFSVDLSVGADVVRCHYDRYEEGDTPWYDGKKWSTTVIPLGTGVTITLLL